MADDFFDDCRARSRSRARARRCTVADIVARRSRRPKNRDPLKMGFFTGCKEVETVKWGGRLGSKCHFHIVQVGRDLGFVENAPSVSYRD